MSVVLTLNDKQYFPTKLNFVQHLVWDYVNFTAELEFDNCFITQSMAVGFCILNIGKRFFRGFISSYTEHRHKNFRRVTLTVKSIFQSLNKNCVSRVWHQKTLRELLVFLLEREQLEAYVDLDALPERNYDTKIQYQCSDFCFIMQLLAENQLWLHYYPNSGTGVYYLSAAPNQQDKLELKYLDGFNNFVLTNRELRINKSKDISVLNLLNPIELQNMPIASGQYWITSLELNYQNKTDKFVRNDDLNCKFAAQAIPGINPPVPPATCPSLVIAEVLGSDTTKVNVDHKAQYYLKYHFDCHHDLKWQNGQTAPLLTSYGGPNSDLHWPLLPGTQVAVGFINADLKQPVIIRSLYNDEQPIPELTAQQNILTDGFGQSILFDDKQVRLQLKSGKQKLTINRNEINWQATGSYNCEAKRFITESSSLDIKTVDGYCETDSFEFGSCSFDLKTRAINISSDKCVSNYNSLTTEVDELKITSSVLELNSNNFNLSSDLIKLNFSQQRFATKNLVLQAGASKISFLAGGVVAIDAKQINITGAVAQLPIFVAASH